MTKRVPPPARAAILRGFNEGTYDTLCCTDILARGINVSADQVVQVDFAKDVTSFLHRAGRTARGPSGSGTLVSLVSPEDQFLVDAIRALHGDAPGNKDAPGSKDAPGNKDATSDARPSVSLEPLLSRNRSLRQRRRREGKHTTSQVD